MKKMLRLAILVGAAATFAFAGPSITVNGNTTFQVKYNAYDIDGWPQFPLVNALVNYTISDWTQGTDNGSTTAGNAGRSPFATGTKFTKFKMSMEIHNTSTEQSWITSLGWVTDPHDVRGYDTETSGLWQQLNTSDPSEYWPNTDGKEFCLSDYDDLCASDANSNGGVQNGKKGNTSAWIYFDGHGSLKFEEFWIRYSGMDYDIYKNGCWYEYKKGIGEGTVVPEPASMAVLASGVGLVALWARRRKKA